MNHNQQHNENYDADRSVNGIDQKHHYYTTENAEQASMPGEVAESRSAK